MQRQLALLLIFVIATHSTGLHSEPSCWERARSAFSVFGVIAGLAALLSCWAKPLPTKTAKRTREKSNTPRNDVLALRDPNGDELVQHRFLLEPGSGDFGLRLIDRSERYSYKMESLQSSRLTDDFIQIQLLDSDEPDSWGVGIFDDELHPSGTIKLNGLPEGLFAISETVFFVFYQNKPFLSFYDLDLQALIWETPIRGRLKIIRSYEKRLYLVFEDHSRDTVQVYQRRPFLPLKQIPVEHGRITDLYVKNCIIMVLYNGLTFRIFNECAVLAGQCLHWITLKDLSSEAIGFKYDGKHVIFTHKDGTETITEITLLPPRESVLQITATVI